MSKFVVLALGLFSCATMNKFELKPEKHFFVISVDKAEKQFDNNKDIELAKVELESDEVYISNYRPIEMTYLQTSINKKKASFLNLFQDDIIPYTGMQKNRKQCLIGQFRNSVLFYSGPDNQWAECSGQKNTKLRALRIWEKCFDTLWQVTIKSENIERFKFQCL